MNKSKAKGTMAETAVVNWFFGRAWPAMRRTLHGRFDLGDVFIHPNVMIEVKATREINLSEFMRQVEVEQTNANAEVGVCIIKRRGTTDVGKWYMVMTVDTGERLLRAALHESKDDAG